MLRIILIVIAFLIHFTCVQAQTWQQIADFPGGERDDGCEFTINNVVYCGNGLTASFSTCRDFYRFDLATDTWDTISAMPAGAQRQAACGFSSNGLGYIFGGYVGYPLADLWQYNPQTNSWLQKTSKPGIGLSGASCFVLNGKAYIIGGNNGNLTIYNQVWEYDIANDSWIQKNDFPLNGTWRATAVTFNNKGYLIFGKDTGGNYNRNLYEYHPQTDSWSILSTFPGPGRMLSSLKAINNTLVVFAGVDSLNALYNNLFYFSFYDSLWYQGVSLPAPGRKEGICFNSSTDLYYTIGLSSTDTRFKETWKLANVIAVKNVEPIEKLKLYPNPCRDYLTLLLSDNPNSTIELINSLGITVYKMQYTLGEKINVSELKAGIYSLNIINLDGTRRTQLVMVE